MNNELDNLPNLPCPFCGCPCDEDPEYDYVGCSNDKCKAWTLAMKREEWNRRADCSEFIRKRELIQALNQQS